MTSLTFSGTARVLLWLAAAPSLTRPALATPRGDGDVGGSVVDSTNGTPLSGGEVRVTRAGSTVAIATTDAFGRYVIHNLSAGGDTIEVRYLGDRAATRDVTVGPGDENAAADLRLGPLPPNPSSLEGKAAGAPAADPRHRHP